MRGSRPVRALLAVAGSLLVPGCHVPRPAPVPERAPVYDEAYFSRKPMPVYVLRTGGERRGPVDTIIGERRTYRIREGDTLLDVGRYHDLGYNEIVDANPGVDPWVPPVGTTIVLPTEWVLPCCTYAGLVLNIPEMRLYHYEPAPGNPGTITVRTYPVGLGRQDRRTPRGRFRVRGKTVNPRWNIPESIRAEHIRERGDARTSIPGGHPDNPLGRYRIELSIPRYSIHGTNVPWGAGMAVSHGCVRLYPEDMEHLFPLVEVGAPVEFAYQPVKVGTRGRGVFVEAHPDLYGFGASLSRQALAALERRGLETQVGRKQLDAVVEGSRGMPVPVEGAERRRRLAEPGPGARPAS